MASSDNCQSKPSNPRHPLLLNLARKALGATGADVEHAVRRARGIARREKRPLRIQDIERCLVDGKPVLEGRLRRRVCIHEAGHVVVARILALGRVSSVSVESSGGTTVIQPNPSQDQDEASLTDHLAFILGGRAAETVILGDTGAGSGSGWQSDLSAATQLAASMEGTLGYGKHHPLLFHSPEALQTRLVAHDDFAVRVHARLMLANQNAERIVGEYRIDVEDLAHRLENESSIRF